MPETRSNLAVMPRRLEEAWEAASDEDKIKAAAEARIALDYMVHYSKRNANHYVEDVHILAAYMLWFRGQK